jgi:D-alanyl-D-alanine carboxypeptidase (penicillin-binding protein 5/6)
MLSRFYREPDNGAEAEFMKLTMTLINAGIILTLACVPCSVASVEIMSKDPYAGAIVIDAATGNVLFEDNPDARAYPASVTKLMVLLLILDAVDADHLTLDEPVRVTAKSSTIGGSQVYLKDNEVFSVDELLYALMVQSANDAAVALAIHYMGSKEVFVDLMNKRAERIGMKDTVFHSVHGLPPGRGQLPDVSTPRDIAKLCLELLKKPDALRYTSTWRRPFRTEAAEPFLMENHNNLLKTMDGCDGLKTGFFWAGGFSIAATAVDEDKRAVAVVLGAKSQRVRDKEAEKMLKEGLSKLGSNSARSSSTSSH